MAKTIYTRVKNKVDSLANWKASTAPLLAGEIALVRVATGASFENPVTGKTEPVVEVLMKIGDGSTAFNSLPWLSAKASDVYNWAKSPTAAEVQVTVIDGGTTTSKTLGDCVKSIAANAADIAKVPDAIENAIKALDSTNSTGSTGNFVKSVVQTDGIVNVTYGNIAESELPYIHTSKIIVADENGDTPKKTLDTKLGEIDAKIAEFDGNIKGGVHFIGEVTSPADLTTSPSTQKVTVDGKEHTAAAGDIVVQGSKEFIWSGTWKELGDLSRVGTLETWRTGLVVNDAKVTSQFVTEVKQTDGKITVSRAQPTISDIKYDETDTLASFLASDVTPVLDKVDVADGKTVTSTITDAINALDVSAPTADGTATAFISGISQTNGKISATKANLPTASNTVAGIVKLGVEGGAAPFGVAANVSAIQGDYVRFNSVDSKLYVGTSGAEEIIFDCGGAPV